MEIKEATHEMSAEQSEQATCEAAALDECEAAALDKHKQKILLMIREHLEDEYRSEMATEFKEVRASVWAFAKEKAREQSTIEELKEKMQAAEAHLTVADKGLKGQQHKEERLAHEILQSK
ncbi:hypothetical protein LPJ61_005923 [Coemansia biformis]|uniref:Uncharacterized protein n=1 Tax=Coemansia biformis TaxID=1286918 RepID=A0A9W7XWX9_9FUNG|nr:hypothetical protein LPJ61_005923 [Coemansia biformis]